MQNHLRNEDFWNNVARKKHYLSKILCTYKNRQYKLLLQRWIGNLRNNNILKTDSYEEALEKESFLPFLRENKITCIDISYQIITTAKKKTKKIKDINIQFINCDVRKMPFKALTFNTIISTSTLDHFSKNDLILSLKQIKKLMKPGGILIITINNKSNSFTYFNNKLEQFFGLCEFPSKFYSLAEIKRILEDLHFRIEKTDYIVYIPPFLNTFLKFFEKINKKKYVKATEGIIRFLENSEQENVFPKKFSNLLMGLYCRKND